MKTKKEALLELEDKTRAVNVPLKDTAANLVFGKGNPDADIIFIGEAPGQQEDIQGKPFVGAAGKLLNQFLASIGITEDDVYIANILKYRPPNNREPSQEEIKAHTPFLIEQIRIIEPKVIVTLGNYATKFILASCQPEEMDSIQGITSLHGKIKTIAIAGRPFKVIPTYHPAALIYNQALRPQAEDDFKIIKAEIGQKSLGNF